MTDRRRQKAEDRRKSIQRSFESVKSLADLLADKGLSTVTGGMPIYKVAKILITHARKYYAERTRRRFEKFHEELLEGIPREAQVEFLASKFSVEEYYSLLNHVVQDEEDKKVRSYAKLFQGLILRALAPEFRLHLIKAARELKQSEFDLIRLIYIHSKYELIGWHSTSDQIEAVTKTDKPIVAASLENLIRLGFLSGKGQSPKPTELLELAAEMVFEDGELTPESIERKRKTVASEYSTVLFAYDGLDERDNVQILISLSHMLFNENIRNSIANPIRPLRRLAPIAVVALCLGSKGGPVENVRKFVGFDEKLVVALLLPGADRNRLPIEGVPNFDFTGEKDAQTEGTRLLELVKEEVKKKGLMSPLT